MSITKKGLWIVALALLAIGLGALSQLLGKDYGVWDFGRDRTGAMLLPLLTLFIMGATRVLAIAKNGEVDKSEWAAYCAFAFMAVITLLGIAWFVGG